MPVKVNRATRRQIGPDQIVRAEQQSRLLGQLPPGRIGQRFTAFDAPARGDPPSRSDLGVGAREQQDAVVGIEQHHPGRGAAQHAGSVRELRDLEVVRHRRPAGQAEDPGEQHRSQGPGVPDSVVVEPSGEDDSLAGVGQFGGKVRLGRCRESSTGRATGRSRRRPDALDRRGPRCPPADAADRIAGDPDHRPRPPPWWPQFAWPVRPPGPTRRPPSARAAGPSGWRSATTAGPRTAAGHQEDDNDDCGHDCPPVLLKRLHIPAADSTRLSGSHAIRPPRSGQSPDIGQGCARSRRARRLGPDEATH